MYLYLRATLHYPGLIGKDYDFPINNFNSIYDDPFKFAAILLYRILNGPTHYKKNEYRSVWS